MLKFARGLFLLLALGLSGCGVLEALLIGGLTGGAGTSYGKPWLDRYLAVPPATEPAKIPAP